MRNKKFLLIISGLFIVIFYFLIVVLFQKPIKDRLKVIFLNVGQGDSTLVMAEAGVNILIDGGPDKTILEKLNKYLPIWNRKIDILILTHPHSDHVTGLVDVLRKYQVNEVWMTGVLHSTPEYMAFLEMIRDKKIEIKITGNIDLSEGGIYPAHKISSNTNIEILYPRKDLLEQKVDNLNNTSLVLKISYKDKSFLFTGDIEKEAETELSNREDIKAEVLKVAHHGSSNSSTEDFLKQVNSEIAVISVGKNDFSMPCLRLLKRLERMGMRIYRTDLAQDIIVETDGKNLMVESGKNSFFIDFFQYLY